ncbi:fructose-specific PTS transporter subunit EIIC [Streptomyces sp. Ru73]|uniref:fructose-specific PTS transporter subunit EIIC n=1 Tax=Streptomyces sp. Ru73 TaxID=2080748 RepID=UPI0015E344F9|nr:fructose-specific PTS transporter subunit EIIC [Streptomyces sp. Ru73]
MTACPTGIAHTYMAAEKLAQAAEALGHEMKVETQGSIGAENVLSDNDVRDADGIIIAADKDVDRARFVGKRVVVVGVAEGIHHPEQLIERVRSAPVYGADGTAAGAGGGTAGTGSAGAAGGGSGGGRERSVAYKALMNGVSYMIPFVVVGGLLIAVSLALGGHPQADGGLVIPDGSFWKHVNDIGTIGFTLMVPILSGYIAYAIGDRPALVPGMIGGWIANTGALYDSKSGAGFIGAIVTGFLAGYLVLWIKKVRVPKFVQPIMPIIVIPIVATTALGLFFIYVIGRPISWVFEHLTSWLGGLTGSSAALLGVLLGLMIAFDMGGPVNKTAFLFGAGLVSKNPEIMGMCAAAIPVPPLGQGLATLVRRRLYDDQERETGLAALFMGCFGITEGAIPFAAARPARIIPSNMAGGAVAGAIAGLAGVTDNVPHGGPIVAVLGAVGGIAMFFVAVAAGTVVTALCTVTLMSMAERRGGARGTGGAKEDAGVSAPEPALTGATAGGASAAGATAAGAVGTAAQGSARTAAQDAGAPAPTDRATAEEARTAAAPGSRTDARTEDDAKTGPKADADTGPEAGADTAPDAGAKVGTGAGAAAPRAADAADAPAPAVLSGYLTPATVKVQLDATEKEAAIREMAELAAGAGKVADVDELVRVALAREAQGTTGLGEEIAIPHAKTDAVTAPVVGFARSAEGIDWGSLDGTLAKLVFMISVPEAAAGDEHLRILALLSRKLMDPDFRARLQAAPDADGIMAVLTEIQ